MSLFVHGSFGQPTINGDIGNRLDNFLSEYEEKGFSGIVWAEKGGEVILKKAYGMADREANKPMTLTSGFDLGSIVKWFTRMAIHKLDVRDKVSISDPLSMYFPEVPPDKADLTIDHGTPRRLY